MRKITPLLTIAACLMIGRVVFAQAEIGYAFFQTAGDWKYGQVYVDGQYVRNIVNGYALLTLTPGEHTITEFRQVTYSDSTRSTIKTYEPKVRFKVEESRLTSIGVLGMFVENPPKYTTFNLRSDESARRYVELYYPQIHNITAQKPILRTTFVYKNNEIEQLRRRHALKFFPEPTNQRVLYGGELGTVVVADGSSWKLLETPTLDRLSPLHYTQPPAKPIFASSLLELFEYNNAFVKIPHDQNNPPVHGAQMEQRLITVGQSGKLSVSTDRGKTWEALDTKLTSEERVASVSSLTDREFIFGTVTSSEFDTSEVKRTGFVVDLNSLAIKKINWLNHVTSSSKFFRVKDSLFMDPVTLGNKAFLFVYDAKKDHWDEVKLPNRPCKIEADSQQIRLICSRGSNFMTTDGVHWQEVK